MHLNVFSSSNRELVWNEVDYMVYNQLVASWHELGASRSGRFAKEMFVVPEHFSDMLTMSSSISRFADCVILLIWSGSLLFVFKLPNRSCPFCSTSRLHADHFFSGLALGPSDIE